MAILFAGSKISDFSDSSGALTNTDAANRDANWSESSIELDAGTDYLEISDIGSQVDVWLHFLVREGSGGTQSDGTRVEFFDEGEGQQIMIIEGDNGEINLEYWNGASLTEVAPGFFLTSSLQTWDVHCKIDNSTGEFAIYRGGALLASFTGDTDLNSTSLTVERVRLSTGHNSSQDNFFSEVILADEDTRGMRLKMLETSANGTNTAWTGDQTDVNDESDGTFISSGTAGQIETYAMANVAAAQADFETIALVVSSRARNDGGGAPQNIRHAIRQGGTNYFGGSNLTLTTAFLGGPNTQTVFTTDPDTAAAWNNTGLDSMEVGVDSVT